MSNVFNKKTGKYDIPLQYECHTWINQTTSQVDSLIAFNCTENTFKYKITYRISDVSFEDKTKFLDSIFNFDNRQYIHYSRHTEKNMPYSMRGCVNKEINDSILDFPLVNLNNDTTSIREREGWILLNFWTLSCAPCIKHLQEMMHEKDSLGYRVLEKENIDILAIEHKSNNMELIGKMAEKTKSDDIMYSAKGIGTEISIPYLGYYYLLAPNKTIVYETGVLGDYSELLKAKEKYEKEHEIIK